MRLTLISKKSRGFSLMELMVIVSILSVLSAIAIPNYLRHRTKGMIGQATKELKTLQRAIQDLGHDTGFWPDDETDLEDKTIAGTRRDHGSEHYDLSGSEMGLDSTNGTYPDWQGPYYKGPWTDPWGTKYFIDYDYHLPDDREVPVVGSYGPDRCCKNDYGEDDIIMLLPASG
jgi:prepilin-type N-terminal cleavage/methylation domain-containing protein